MVEGSVRELSAIEIRKTMEINKLSELAVRRSDSMYKRMNLEPYTQWLDK